jgi:hypothetical protein
MMVPVERLTGVVGRLFPQGVPDPALFQTDLPPFLIRQSHDRFTLLRVAAVWYFSFFV